MSLFVLGSAVHCDWLKHSQPPTHQLIQLVTGLFTPSYLICVYLSKAESVSQSDLRAVYTQIMPPMEGRITPIMDDPYYGL